MAGKWLSFGGLNVNSNEDAEHTLKKLRILQWITMIILWIMIAIVFYSLYLSYTKKSVVMESRENPLKGTTMVDGKDVLTEEYLKEDYKSYYYGQELSIKGTTMLFLGMEAAFLVYVISATLGSIVRARVLGKPLDKEKCAMSLGLLAFGAVCIMVLPIYIWCIEWPSQPSPEKASYNVSRMVYQGKKTLGSGKSAKYKITYIENGEYKEKEVGDFTYAMYPDDACTLYVATFHYKDGDKEFYTYRADEYTLP